MAASITTTPPSPLGNMERQYYEREFAKNLQNSKNSRRLAKSLLNASCASNAIDALKLDGRIVTDHAQLAHAFNGFFTGIGRTLAQKIRQGQKTVDDFLCHTIPNSFALVPTNLHEILDIANSAKSTRAEGPDGNDPILAKN